MKGLNPDRPLSLYIHVPFCLTKCDYCAFYSLPESAVGTGWVDRYMSILLSEIDAMNREWGRPYHTIFIGGGNPGMLGMERIARMLRKAEEHGMPKEATMEINPESLDEGISELEGLLTRVSIGVQSMDDDVLAHLGRNARRDDNLKALSILSRSDFSWNADIITAVPGSTVSGTIADIDEVASYGPGHISFYCLSFEEGTRLVEREAPLGEDEEARFLESGWKRLNELGYEHYEVSNFARPGCRCLHNQVYWDLGQYVGFGPGAESSIGWSRAVSMRENETLESYLSSPELSCTPLSAEETEEELLLAALRTSDGIGFDSYRERFGKDFLSQYGEAIAALDKSTYTMDSSRFALTEKGFMALDWIILRLAAGL